MSTKASAADLLLRIRHMEPWFRQFSTRCVVNLLSLNAGIPSFCLIQIPRRCLGNPASSPRLAKFPSLSAGSGTHER